LSAYGGKWTESRLSQFLENPQAVVPGTAMEIAGVPDPRARAQIIDYLRNAKKVVLQ
jgi:cytochrome c